MLCFIFCCACTKEDPLTISDPSLELKYDSKHLFTVKKGAQTLSNSLIDWKVSDTKIGIPTRSQFSLVKPTLYITTRQIL